MVTSGDPCATHTYIIKLIISPIRVSIYIFSGTNLEYQLLHQFLSNSIQIKNLKYTQYVLLDISNSYCSSYFPLHELQSNLSWWSVQIKILGPRYGNLHLHLNNTFEMQLKFHSKLFLDLINALNLMVPTVCPYLYPFSHSN